MFDTAWVLPQQLTSLLMRRALSSSQMALPGTLPSTHTHTHTHTRNDAHMHIYSTSRALRHAHTRTHNPVSPCCTPNCCWLSAPLTPPLPPPPSSLHPLHCLSVALHPSLPPSLAPSISGSCLSMSQHCRCHNSPAGKTLGDERRRCKRRSLLHLHI